MSVLLKVQKGKQIKPQMYTVYGMPGVGKTTLASQFPNPIILDLENGSSHLDVARINDIGTLQAFNDSLTALLNESHTYQTLVIDSLEALESLLHEDICQTEVVDSIEKACGGWSKGYIRASEMGRAIFKNLRLLCDRKGMTVVSIGHAVQKSFTDAADSTSYDRYVFRLHHKFAAVVFEMSDNVLFASHKVYTTKEQGKTKAFSDGDRVMRTQWRSGFDAKNRLDLPFEIPLSYQALRLAIETSKAPSLGDLQVEVLEMIKGIDKDIQVIAIDQTTKAATVPELLAIKNRVSELLRKTA